MHPVPAALLDASRSDLLPHGATILLAVSGGADSTALLYSAAEVLPLVGWTLAVGHVHHGLRGREADRDLAFVGDHARRLGLSFFWRAVDAAAHARRAGLSREAAARQLRYEALASMKADARASRIATAHHRDDRLESFLLARERRGGVAALGGPLRLRADGVARPLLFVEREELRRYLDGRGISWRRDASNGDLSLARNRVRRSIAALAAEGGGSRLAALRAEADAAAEARDRLEEEFEERVRPELRIGAGTALADARSLAALGRDLQRRAITELAAALARPGRAPLTGREREQLLDRLAAGGDFRFEAGRRVRFERHRSILTVKMRKEASRV